MEERGAKKCIREGGKTRYINLGKAKLIFLEISKKKGIKVLQKNWVAACKSNSHYKI